MRRFDGLFGVAFQQDGSVGRSDAQDHGVVIFGLEADGPILWRKKDVDLGTAEIEIVSLPMAYDGNFPARAPRRLNYPALDWAEADLSIILSGENL